MHQTNVNSGEEYLIPDATTNDFGILAGNYEWIQCSRQDCDLITDKLLIENGTPGEEGFKGRQII
jgi:iron complex outermembrane receptor protein